MNMLLNLQLGLFLMLCAEWNS